MALKLTFVDEAPHIGCHMSVHNQIIGKGEKNWKIRGSANLDLFFFCYCKFEFFHP